jgi:hypothetical protein
MEVTDLGQRRSEGIFVCHPAWGSIITLFNFAIVEVKDGKCKVG